LNRLLHQQVKQRTKRLTELFESYKPYENREGKIDTILVTEESRDKKYYVGHNKFYEQILIPKDDYFIGKMVKVKIISSAKYYMMASPLTSSFWPFKFSKFINHYINLDQKMIGLIVFNFFIASSFIIKMVYKK
jgi:CDK5 regulatory subunit-associated protein 1-like 1